MATLRCEMSGYLLPDEDLQWYKGHNIIYNHTENRFFTSFEEGTPNSAQNGGIRPVASRISLLTISSSVLSDAGDYVCRVRGSDVFAVVTLSVERDNTGTTTVGGEPNYAVCGQTVCSHNTRHCMHDFHDFCGNKLKEFCSLKTLHKFLDGVQHQSIWFYSITWQKPHVFNHITARKCNVRTTN